MTVRYLQNVLLLIQALQVVTISTAKSTGHTASLALRPTGGALYPAWHGAVVLMATDAGFSRVQEAANGLSAANVGADTLAQTTGTTSQALEEMSQWGRGVNQCNTCSW